MSLAEPIVASPPFPADWTFADLQEHLGGIPAERIWLYPPPGTATKNDVIEIEAKTNRLCELIDGILVEKAMGSFASRLAAVIIHFIETYLDGRPMGASFGADSMLEVAPDQVRMPDVAFFRRERFPGGRIPRDPIYPLTPDLAVEVLSKKNTKREMRRKLLEYFAGGARLVWYIDPRQRTARVFTAPNEFTDLADDGVLTGADLLPGFELPLRKLFERAERL